MLAVGDQLGEFGGQGAPLGGRERTDDADVVQHAAVVVQPQLQGAHGRAGLGLGVPAQPGDHAVRGARMLDLEHGPLAGHVVAAGGLGDHAVQPGAFEDPEPFGRGVRVVGDRRGAQSAVVQAEAGEQFAALGLRCAHEVAVVQREQVERDERGRCLLGEHPDAAGGRVDALAQRVPVQPVADLVAPDHHELPVEHRGPVELFGDRPQDFGEVPVQRPTGAGLQQHRLLGLRIGEHQAPETIPLRLEQQAALPGDAVDRAGQHRLHRWLHWQHRVLLAEFSGRVGGVLDPVAGGSPWASYPCPATRGRGTAPCRRVLPKRGARWCLPATTM